MEGERMEQTQEDEARRKKRLELNRKAAKESRMRKKLRIEELNQSLQKLANDNEQLREKAEVLVDMMSQRHEIVMDPDDLEKSLLEQNEVLRSELASFLETLQSRR